MHLEDTIQSITELMKILLLKFLAFVKRTQKEEPCKGKGQNEGPVEFQHLRTDWVLGEVGFLAGNLPGTLHRPTYRQPPLLSCPELGWCWADQTTFHFSSRIPRNLPGLLPASKEQYI